MHFTNTVFQSCAAASDQVLSSAYGVENLKFYLKLPPILPKISPKKGEIRLKEGIKLRIIDPKMTRRKGNYDEIVSPFYPNCLLVMGCRITAMIENIAFLVQAKIRGEAIAIVL